MTGHHRDPKQKLRASYRAPSLKQTSHVAMDFHRRVWYRAFSLHYACNRHSGIILIPSATIVPNFVSFATSIAEQARGKILHTQLFTSMTSAFISIQMSLYRSFVNKTVSACFAVLCQLQSIC